MQSLLKAIHRLWLLILAVWNPRKKSSPTVLPVSAKDRSKFVGKPEPASQWPRREATTEKRKCLVIPCNRSKSSDPRKWPQSDKAKSYLSSHAKSKHQLLNISDGRKCRGEPHLNVQNSHFAKPFHYHTDFPDANNPPPRPPRTPSTDFGSGPGSSDDEFGWNFDVHLPAVIVTPCTPTESSIAPVVAKTGSGARRDGSPLDESSSVSLDSATTFPTSNSNSNPHLNRSTSAQNIFRSFTPEPSHCRTRSLTGTGNGWKREQLHRRLSQGGYVVRSHRIFLSSLAGEVSDLVLPNPVQAPATPPSIDFPCPSPPGRSHVSVIHPGPTTVCNFGPTVSGQLVRFVATNMPVEQPTGSSDQICAPDRSLDTSILKVNDDRAADEKKTGSLALNEGPIFGESVTHSTQDTVKEELCLVPYPDVFDLDAYYGPCSLGDESLSSGSSLYASCSTPGTSESSDSFLSLSQASKSSPMSTPNELEHHATLCHPPLRLLDDSLSSSKESDSSSCSNSRRFGLIKDGRNEPKMDYEVKRYRDHYRPPAYSRPPAFTVEYATTMKKSKESSTSELSSSENSTSSMVDNSEVVTLVTPTENSSTTPGKTEAKGSQIPRAMSSSVLRSKRTIKITKHLTKDTLLVRSSTATHLFNASVPAPLFRPRVSQQGPGTDKILSGPLTEVSSPIGTIMAPCRL